MKKRLLSLTLALLMVLSPLSVSSFAEEETLLPAEVPETVENEITEVIEEEIVEVCGMPEAENTELIEEIIEDKPQLSEQELLTTTVPENPEQESTMSFVKFVWNYIGDKSFIREDGETISFFTSEGRFEVKFLHLNYANNNDVAVWDITNAPNVTLTNQSGTYTFRRIDDYDPDMTMVFTVSDGAVTQIVITSNGLDLADYCGTYTSVPSHTHTLSEVPVSDATCTTDGVKTAYWVCSGEGGCGKFFADNNAGTGISAEDLAANYIIPAAHTYGAVSCQWNGESCTATRTCTVCAEGTDGHSISETKEGSYAKDTGATCLAAETGHYAVTFDDAQFGSASSDSFSVGAPLAHSYTGEVKDNGNGTHSFKCVNGCGEYGGTEKCTDGNGDNMCDKCGATMYSVSLSVNTKINKSLLLKLPISCTYSFKPTVTGAAVRKVQYSLDGGYVWFTGTCFTIPNQCYSYFVRVYDTTGAVTTFLVRGGNTVIQK